MNSSIQLRSFYIAGGLFIFLNCLGIYFDFFWLPALPILAIFFLLAVIRLDLLLLSVVFLVPLSINIEDIGLGLGISLPDEPLIIAVFLLVIYKFIIDGNYDFSILRHPISVAILVNTTWIAITCLGSEQIIVSIKFLLSRTWYILLFYFLGVAMFKNLNHIAAYLWAYILPLAAVIIYTLVKHSEDNFSQVTSFEIMSPFYIAHGIYAAAVAFFIPLFFCYLLFGFRINSNFLVVVLSAAFILLFGAGVAFSFTRAAWISLAAAAGFGVLMLFRIRLWQMMLVLSVATVFVIINFDDIFYQLYQNKQNSAEGFEKHLESVSNVRNDVSNLERLNRWMSAVNMVKARPIMGFGPGAFSFTYAPYQDPEFKTPITTAFGDQGHAHSEFLNPMAESGWLGLITLLVILYFVFEKGLNLVYDANDLRVKIYAAGVLLGLVTYFVHGLMNNYSEQDKIAVLIWGSFAMITAMDIYHKEEIHEDLKILD